MDMEGKTMTTTGRDTMKLGDARSYFDGSTEDRYLDPSYALEQIATADSDSVADAIRTLYSYQATRRNIERRIGHKLNLSQTTALEAIFNGADEYGKVSFKLWQTHRRARRRAELALDQLIDSGALILEIDYTDPDLTKKGLPLYVNPELVAELEEPRPEPAPTTPTPKPAPELDLEFADPSLPLEHYVQLAEEADARPAPRIDTYYVLAKLKDGGLVKVYNCGHPLRMLWDEAQQLWLELDNQRHAGELPLIEWLAVRSDADPQYQKLPIGSRTVFTPTTGRVYRDKVAAARALVKLHPHLEGRVGGWIYRDGVPICQGYASLGFVLDRSSLLVPLADGKRAIKKEALR